MSRRNIKCRKCSHLEKLYIDEETVHIGNYSRLNTFLCKKCNQLSTINTVKKRVLCKNCNSADLIKFFPESSIKCPKCENKAFDSTTGVDF